MNQRLQKSGVSSHSSTSTVYNPSGRFGKGAKSQNQFEYNHLLSASLQEFNWHLKDEIFQLQKTKIKNLPAFKEHLKHIRDGVRRKFPHCKFGKRKIVLKKVTITNYTEIVEAKLKMNAARIVQMQNKGPAKSKVHREEDNSFLSVDPSKFFKEFVRLFTGLNEKFYECKLQQLSELLYYLDCSYADETTPEQGKNRNFKILVRLINKRIKNEIIKSGAESKNNNASSPSSTLTPHLAEQIRSTAIIDNRRYLYKKPNILKISLEKLRFLDRLIFPNRLINRLIVF